MTKQRDSEKVFAIISNSGCPSKWLLFCVIGSNGNNSKIPFCMKVD